MEKIKWVGLGFAVALLGVWAYTKFFAEKDEEVTVVEGVVKDTATTNGKAQMAVR